MTSICQTILAIFGLGAKNRDIDLEWGKALERMRRCTDEIKETRYVIKLNTARDRLLEGQRQLHLRMNHFASSMEPSDGPGKIENS